MLSYVSGLPIGLLLVLTLALQACNGPEPVERRNDDGVVVERYTRNPTDSSRHGSYEAFTDDGQLVERANYTHDRLTGERRLYYPNGQVQYVETYVDGEFQGPYRSYYPDGTLQLEGQYIDNVATGLWTGYYPSGEKKEEVTFANNAENGPFKEWYSNGAIKAEGNYLDGDHEQGELLLYDLQGDVQKRMYCEAGICRTVWQANATESNG